MAATDVELPNVKTWVLKVSIHCEACKKKVKKILNAIEGVFTIDADIKQQRVVVTGNVEAEVLLKKLAKAGKHPVLWPEKSDRREEKESGSKQDKHANSLPVTENYLGSKEISPPGTSKEAAVAPAKTRNGGDSPGKDIVGGDGGKVGDSVAKSSCDGAVAKSPGNEVQSSGDGGAKHPGGHPDAGKGKSVAVDEKAEGKKPVNGSAGSQAPPPGMGTNGAQSEGMTAGGGKKKKKEGQNGKTAVSEPLNAAPAVASSGERNHDGGPQQHSPPAIHLPPRHLELPHAPYYPYGPPPPIYGVSYNTSHPTGIHTASFYAPEPPFSFAYAYQGREMDPPPSDLDSYPRQPLDSLDLFSDENPNGCSVM